jgi:uncharacterized protein
MNLPEPPGERPARGAIRIVYLHGFRSSPASRKAVQLRAALAARPAAGCSWACPQLPASPREAIEVALEAIGPATGADLALVGSSLGGYYATHLAERLGCRAVLLNPAIRPFDDLGTHLGRQTVHGSADTIDMKPHYLDELIGIDTPVLTLPQRYLLIAATGDEVIDWRTMVAKYRECPQRVIEGSDHALGEFADHADAVLSFCGVAP